ncbi:MAG: hypothetical protein ABI718_08575 [Acidobacteriota bacterium]
MSDDDSKKSNGETASDRLSEFAGFVRNAGVQAMNRLAETAKHRTSDDPASKTGTAVRKITAVWTRLSAGEKDAFMERVVMTGQALAMAVPAAAAAAVARSRDNKKPGKKPKKTKPVVPESQSSSLNEDPAGSDHEGKRKKKKKSQKKAKDENKAAKKEKKAAVKKSKRAAEDSQA